MRALFAEHQAEAERSLDLSRKRVIDGLKAAMALAREQGAPVATISGWREIGKLCGHYAPERRPIELHGNRDASRAQ